ncbi:50S ribosomal protein L29 [Hazenella sp. IB182357]|uniref:Large ribosomal subunit protein uL29 n=1 Tax=Polycladospora coralii TaxID=2771432 RepID=A0A926NB10_9BACL|nr:50S ribosomal protein L29 [Polycladospora coralii]MBD1372355.1 50S ribosomal protein L29 [Polycladospora coralii]MBS7531455.1 50S ribosomal protein L29 [Polycladospora coralii]
MKAQQLIELTTAEIEQKLAQYKEELFNLRFQSATGQLENPARIGQVRKNIARCKTTLRERELGIERRKQG